MRPIPARVLAVVLPSLFLWSCQATPSSPPYPDARPDRAQTSQEDGVFSTELVGFDRVAAEQRESVWCWAACAEMILRFNGVETSQEEIAARVLGTDEDGEAKVLGASFYEIMCALNPDMERTPFEEVWKGLEEQLEADPTAVSDPSLSVDRGAVGGALFAQYAPSSSIAVEDLRNGHPAVVGLHDPELPESRHACVLIGAEYTVNEGADRGRDVRDAVGDLFGGLGLGTSPADGAAADEAIDRVDGDRYPTSKVTLLDPWTGETLSLTDEELAERVDFVITKRKARETLMEWRSAATLESRG